jgi:hypothetical protein
MTNKKERNCGCGCLPESKKDARVQKLEVKKSEKPKS